MFSKLATMTILSLGLATGALAQSVATPNDQPYLNDGAPKSGTMHSRSMRSVDPSITNSVRPGTTMNPSTTLSSDGNCSAPVSAETVERSKNPVTRTQC